jgi:hypothetical protein
MAGTTYSLNTMQMLAVTGIIISLFAQLILLLVGKEVHNFWAVYPTWVGVFGIGSLFKHFGPAAHHHHGDDHHHDH